MAVYRRTYTVAGQGRTARKFTVQFADQQRIIRRLPGFADRKAGEELERKMLRLVDCHTAGEVLPRELSRFVDALPGETRGKLAKWGLIDIRRLASAAGLFVHVDAFEKSLEHAGRVETHVKLTAGRLRKLIKLAGFETIADVSAERVQRALAKLRDGTADVEGRGGERGQQGDQEGDAEEAEGNTRRRRGVSQATSNHFLTALKAFIRWMIANDRAADTASLQTVLHIRRQTVTDKRHDRRALTGDEVHRLISYAETGPTRGKQGGEERALLYRVAVETGLRAGELRQLRRMDLQLGADHPSDRPTVTVPAKVGKNRKEAKLPLRADTAQALAKHVEGKMPASRVFAVPIRFELPKVIRADLEAARAKWLQEAATPAERAEREGSHFLAYRDGNGHAADFHSLRHTFISRLAAAGVHPKLAQTLARHGTIGLTMDRYTHVDTDRLAGAVDALPGYTSPNTPAEQRATGTDGRNALERETPQAPTMRIHRPEAGTGYDSEADGDESEPRAPKVAPKGMAQTVTNDDEQDAAEVAVGAATSHKKPRFSAIAGKKAGLQVSEADGDRTRNLRIDSPVL